MVLFVTSLANVSWQGINPPGAGGNPLVYPATTLATLADWPPESCCSFPAGPASLPSRWIPAAQTQTPLELQAIVLVLIPQLARIMKRQEHSRISLLAGSGIEALSDFEHEGKMTRGEQQCESVLRRGVSSIQ